ncbi:transmembrane protein 131-like isoform X2 [Ruditapes philippinarum]|uniref:transmembrane protein 131-like isoform X2 n=1 Tax=Ruditapes philippinarum TaxID=129788 RepID=UPI00295C2B14|nr:transmembrane protein 131-like isoform X2 [Ruditapes philippinarum]
MKIRFVCKYKKDSMARIKRKEMSKHFTILFLFFQTLCQICHSLETVESHNQAFIQTDKHLTYIVGDVSSGIPIEVKAGQVYNDYIGKDEILLPNAIQLDPPMLDFQEQPVGMPRMEHVTVHNSDSKNNLHLLSISGSTAHFHCSFFQDKIVPPGGNTTFDVVFLARQEGNVENTLYIHTSLGSFKYQVFGVGTANPYRLRPYLGARVPVNSSFSPLINMHNPHSTPLQVLEMFASEGDLHLELPTGEKEAPRSLWEIPPYETKTIMKANFVGRTENNHTAFIRIKTDKHDLQHTVVLPMEVEVTSSPGVYVATELIDFGIVRTFDEPKTVPINLINTGDTPVQISSVTLSPPNEAVSVDFRPIKLQPELLRQTTVAHVTFRASKAIHPKLWSGKIIVRSKNNVHKISIPYEAKVLHGSLTYHKNATYFDSGFDNITRYLGFTNTFNFSLVLFNVTIPAEVRQHFSILNFTRPVILPPQMLITPFILKFHPQIHQIHFKTILSLHTNASVFEIELVVYNGFLKIVPHRPEKLEGQLDFGTMGVKENKSVLFTLINDNPVTVYFGEWSTDMKGATLELLGIEKGNGTTLTRKHNVSAIDLSNLSILPYHFAVFSLNLVAPEEEGLYQAEVIFATDYQNIFIPVMLRTSEGSLHAIPERVVFDKVFPGRIPTKILQVHSTFHDQMVFKSVTFQPPDHRWYFVSAKEENASVNGNSLLILEPQTNNTIGKIFFDSKKDCKEECYVGLSTFTLAGHRWLQGLQLNKDTSDTDESLYKHLRQRWKNLQEQGKDRVNITIEIDTSTVQGFLFSAHVQQHWPDIIRRTCRHHVKFPLTQIGNLSTIDLVVENNGDIPLLVQVVPLHLYPNPQTIINLLHDKLPPNFSEYVETDDPDIFILSEVEKMNAYPDSALIRFRENVESKMGVKSHRDTITTFLTKGFITKIKVQVGFRPKDDSLKTSLIIVRNNLTIIDAIVLEGQGGKGELKLNNKKPGISTLQFDIAEKHLKNCDKRKHAKNLVPNFTVKRSFTLRNTGELPFYVHGFSINNAACEGYGFRVLECEGYEMLPNTSRKVDIAFTPDFTMSRIQRTLTIFTSLGTEFNYTLQATVPTHTLSKCAASLPRPNWEPVLYYSIVCVMSFILFCILVASYFEADRIFVADILKRKVKMCNGTPTYQKEKIFDLKNIGVSHINGQSSPVSTPKTLQPSNLNRIPRPIIEMTNGHVEHQTRESFMTYLSGLFKSFFVRKPSTIRKKVNNNVESPAPSSKHAPDSTAMKENVVTEKVKPLPSQDVVIPEKSNHIYSQQKLTLRKPKPVKKSPTEISPPVDNQNLTPSSNYERKHSNKSNTSQMDKKTDTPNIVKDITPPVMTTQDSSGLACFDEVKPYDNKQKCKKKLRSKPERDNIIKDRLLLRQNDDKDETSSTTTDSSTGDLEEKSLGTRNGTPEPAPAPVTKPKKKNKARNLEPLIMPQPDDDTDEFELTSKSRAYKKVKGQLSGEQLKPSLLDIDLPYNIDKTKPKKKKVSPGVKETEKKEKQKDDLSELSIQTDQFAQKQAKVLEPGTHLSNISPDGLTSSSRSSSYSSIVSNSSGEGANGKKGDKRTPTAVAGYTPFSDTIPVSVIPKTSPPMTAKRNAWGTSSTPTTPETIGFGLQTIQESSRPGNTLTDSQAGVFTQSSFTFGLNVPSSTDGNYGFSNVTYSSQQQESLTMMQRLQMERRRRIKEHQSRILKTGDDWPGFGVPLTRNESLWDSEYNPLDPNNTWAMAPETPPAPNETGLWSTLTHSANNSWNSLMGIWGGSGTQTSVADPLSADIPYTTTEGTSPVSTAVTQSADALPAFNPFSTDIWSPSASTASSGWTLPGSPPASSADDQRNDMI